MKLSEAIRLGALIRPHLHWGFHVEGASCTLGAVAEAVGLGYPLYGSEQIEAQDAMREMFPLLKDMNVWLGIVDRNHAQTREAIADWIEQLERQQEEPSHANLDINQTPAPESPSHVGSSDPVTAGAV